MPTSRRRRFREKCAGMHQNGAIQPDGSKTTGITAGVYRPFPSNEYLG